MRFIIFYMVSLFAIAVTVDVLFEGRPTPRSEQLCPTPTMLNTLDNLIAKSVQRQREINEGLDKALELNRRVTLELRNFHHNP